MTNSRTTSNNIENQKEYSNHDNHNNSNTQPGVLPNEAMERIGYCYVANIGPLTQASAQLIEDALKDGFDAETVILAIRETGLAPRPTAFYLRAILRNWKKDGVRTRFKESRPSGSWWQNPALNYQQRQYTAEDDERLFVNLDEYLSR